VLDTCSGNVFTGPSVSLEIRVLLDATQRFLRCIS